MAAGHRSRKGDKADPRIFDHPGDLRVIEVQVLEDPFRQSHRPKSLGIGLSDERRLGSHLEENTVAGEQRGDHGIDRGEPRIVPRSQYQNHSNRLLTDEAVKPRLWVGTKIGQRILSDPGHVPNPLLKAATQLRGARGDRSAHLPGKLLSEAIRPLHQPFGQPERDSDAFGERNPSPLRLSPHRRRQGLLDLSAGCQLALNVETPIDRADRLLPLSCHRFASPSLPLSRKIVCGALSANGQPAYSGVT